MGLIDRRAALATLMSGTFATVLLPAANACSRRKQCRRPPVGQSVQGFEQHFDDPTFEGFAGEYVNELYGRRESTLFGIRMTGDVSGESGQNMIESEVVPILRQRRASHKLDEWQIIPDT